MGKKLFLIFLVLVSFMFFGCQEEEIPLDSSLVLSFDGNAVSFDDGFDFTSAKKDGEQSVSFELKNTHSKKNIVVSSVTTSNPEYSVESLDGTDLGSGFTLVPGQILVLVVTLNPEEEGTVICNLIVSASYEDGEGLKELIFPITSDVTGLLGGFNNTGFEIRGNKKSYQFGDVAIGESVVRPVIIENVSSRRLKLTRLEFSSSVFSSDIETFPVTLDAGGSY
ncbi:MAG: hypothetical protein JXR63_00005, partial [Spirochaetales bacterium]|nr:hypothetical protein [Spirochaetales bacterium]